MDPTVTIMEYIGFVVAALILGWAVVELNRRYFRQKKINVEPLNTWVKLDTTHTEDVGGEEVLPGEDADNDEEDTLEPGIHSRAQQNGHYSESKKLL